MYVVGYALSKTYTRRAAVMPYTFDKDNRLLFLVGKDKNSGDITDFGGGRKKYEYSLNAAIREFNEETSGVFSPYIHATSCNEYTTNPAIIDDDLSLATLFIYIPYDVINSKIEHFTENKEVRSLHLVSRSFLVNNKGVWGRIQRFYSKNMPSANFFYNVRTFRK